MKCFISKFSSSARGRVTSFLSIMFVASLLSGLASSRATSAEQGAPDSKQPSPASTEELRNREAWNETMSRTPMPKKGCFTAAYPNTEWQEVPCTTAPNQPYSPRRGPRPATVGNGNDVSAQAPSGFISTAIGSFDSVNYVTSVSDPGGQSNFALQLNTNFFANSSNNVPACNGAANATACQGWQQFIYSNSGVAFMQYWLINYATTCPMGWNTAGNNCWRNGTNQAAQVPVQTIANLSQLRVTGQANSGGTDTVIMAWGGGSLNASNQDSVLNLAQNWQAAEFNIVGDCCSTQANFNAGSTIVGRTRIIYGGTAPPPSAGHKASPPRPTT